MALTFSTIKDDTRLVLKLGGQLDALSAPELRPTISKIAEEKHPTIEVDLSDLELIDSSGVGAILALYKHCKKLGSKMKVTGAKDQPLAIFKLLRMDKVFQMS